MADNGYPAYKGKIKAGDRVQHIGTKAWAEVLEVHSRGKHSAELYVKQDKAPFWDPENKPTFWATYHVGQHEPKKD